MPTLYVLGGANGVGKTTWYQIGIENIEVNPEIPFINIDTIVLHELGGYSPENIAIGEQLARERIKLLIQERKDFMIESNLSKSSDYEWIALMRKNGYKTVLFFLGTKDVEINKARVQARVREGGHDIAEPIIEHRYRMGISYLKSNILLFSEATLFDVSTDEPRKITQLQNGQIIFRDSDFPAWAKDSLQIAEKLKINTN
jgi:predicted ABC-type ATPase